MTALDPRDPDLPRKLAERCDQPEPLFAVQDDQPRQRALFDVDADGGSSGRGRCAGPSGPSETS